MRLLEYWRVYEKSESINHPYLMTSTVDGSGVVDVEHYSENVPQRWRLNFSNYIGYVLGREITYHCATVPLHLHIVYRVRQ